MLIRLLTDIPRRDLLEAWSGFAPLREEIGAFERLATPLFAEPDRLLQRADEQWSLGALTLPHMLVRLLVAEQLYRAASMLANHPYHRA